MASLAPKSDFFNLDKYVHLGAGGEPPQLKSLPDVLAKFAVTKSTGPMAKPGYRERENEARDRLSRMMNVPPSDLAFLGGCSEATNLICWSLLWQPGDNVVINDMDYPSMIYPFAALERRKGVEVRLIKSKNFEVRLEDFEEAIDDRTRLVSVSHVGYLTGLRQDINTIADLAHSRGAAVITDISHSLGIVPMDLSEIDFAVSCTYKWTLGIHGLGITYWNRRRQPDFEPLFIGQASIESRPTFENVLDVWPRPDASSMTVGNSSWVSVYALVNGLRYINALGSEEVFQHVHDLARKTRRGLVDLGLNVVTPEDPDRHAANVVFWHDDWQAIWDELFENNIIVWAGDGRVRISPFVYNDEDDVDHLLEFLRTRE